MKIRITIEPRENNAPDQVIHKDLAPDQKVMIHDDRVSIMTPGFAPQTWLLEKDDAVTIELE